MDVPDLNYSGPVPLYVQIADWIDRQVETGKLARGSKLPAERDLAEMYQVAYLTVRRAMRELRQRGTVITTVGRGTYIA